jgi:hypothetical protein
LHLVVHHLESVCLLFDVCSNQWKNAAVRTLSRIISYQSVRRKSQIFPVPQVAISVDDLIAIGQMLVSYSQFLRTKITPSRQGTDNLLMVGDLQKRIEQTLATITQGKAVKFHLVEEDIIVIDTALTMFIYLVEKFTPRCAERDAVVNDVTQLQKRLAPKISWFA